MPDVPLVVVKNSTGPGAGRARHDEVVRHLRLRGGILDGTTWSGVIDVGKRVSCGTGFWSTESVYVVTGDTTNGPDGRVESVAVPAVF